MRIEYFFMSCNYCVFVEILLTQRDSQCRTEFRNKISQVFSNIYNIYYHLIVCKLTILIEMIQNCKLN